MDNQHNDDNQRNQKNNFNAGRFQQKNDRFLMDKLHQMEMTDTYELPPIDNEPKKFSGQSRLYIGNIPPGITEEEINGLFSKFGETSELFINKEKNFGFIKLDYIFNAERAKKELNGNNFKGKYLKIRTAPNGSSIKVKNLDDCVTNELLHYAFSVFGEIDRCVVIVDDRGKTTGEGIVEFSRKNAAQFALRKCQEGCFLLTKSGRPVVVEPYEGKNEVDGFPEKMIGRKSKEYLELRRTGPKLSLNPQDFEFEYGQKWKNLLSSYEEKLQAVRKEMQLEKEKLMAQMEFERYESETNRIRNQLQMREMGLDQPRRNFDFRNQNLDDGHMMDNQGPPPPPFMNQESLARGPSNMGPPLNNSFKGGPDRMQGGRGRGARGRGGSRWPNENWRNNDDFQNKRRRF